jgi:hypothetical protein
MPGPITGTHSGPAAGPGITCVQPGAVITGPVTISAGAAVSIQDAQVQRPPPAKGPATLAVSGMPPAAAWR